MVTSPVGSERTHTNLEVWAPLSAHISPQVQKVDVGGIATFNCSAEGFPQDSVAWFKVGVCFAFISRVRIFFKLTKTTLFLC